MEETYNQKSFHSETGKVDSVALQSLYAYVKNDSLNNLALDYWRSGDYQKSLNIINIAYKRAEKEENDTELAKILNTLGLVQWRLGNNEDAMSSYSIAGNIAAKLNMTRLLGLTHTNRGLILKEQGDYESAFMHNNRAIQLFRTEHEYRDLGIALNNQGQIFKNKQLNDSAKSYYLEALRHYEKADYKDGEAATYYNLSDIYLRERNQALALNAIQKSLRLSLQIERKIRISEAYQKLSEVYEAFNKTDSALKYYKLYAVTNNGILIANQSKTLAEYQAKMGSEVKNLQIQNLKKESQLNENRNWFIGLAILSFLLIGVFFVYRHFQKIRFKKRKLEIQLNSSNKILTIKEQELKTYILDLSKKNAIIDSLQKELQETNAFRKNDTAVTSLLEQKILTEDDWTVFKSRFNSIYPGFFGKIQQHNIALTEGEIRYLVLLNLDLKSKEMSHILGISPQSVRVSKMRLKKKIIVRGYHSVEEFLGELT
ncbi:hypothetical protein GCM10011506_18400 [Marivirga lumbricoides]|uniref:HTH luxR-type domain-containing protein n=1 Tax=Marivirga lumbricoides TaxID=1046115 RepID=A0ABQ1M1B8_9BACT|nr:hypothetical protein GCM10011506_18400 [Marivirga lumbricoides]